MTTMIHSVDLLVRSVIQEEKIVQEFLHLFSIKVSVFSVIGVY